MFTILIPPWRAPSVCSVSPQPAARSPALSVLRATWAGGTDVLPAEDQRPCAHRGAPTMLEISANADLHSNGSAPGIRSPSSFLSSSQSPS